MREEELAVYDGVIITHGSDTLPYTCAALAFLLRDVPIPLVLVASNYSLGDSRSNGLANFRSAVELIASRQVRGVFTVFQDEKAPIVCILPPAFRRRTRPAISLQAMAA